MLLTKAQKQKIDQIGKKYNLRLILLFGSFSRGEARPESDLDIAILGQEPISFDTLLRIYSEMPFVFDNDGNKRRDLDLVSLHDVNPLFRFYVMRDSILLYGKSIDYYSFKAYAFRDYQESQSLLKLMDILINKRQKYLLKNYA
jgi:predicted nucleotidyltransferase